MSMMSEFKEFAMRGNVVDMAVGIVIGGAFGKIVSSFVADVLMPLIGLLLGGIDFTQLSFDLQPLEASEPVTVNYGIFLQSFVDFLIIAFAIFMMVKAMNAFRKKDDEAPPEEPEKPSEEVVLLTEIRDALSAREQS